MRLNKPLWLTTLLCAWVVLMLDVGTKAWAQVTLDGQAPRKIIGTLLQLTFARNSGAAFSFISNGTIFLSTFALLVVALIAFWAPRITSRPWCVVMGLVLGGTLGNLSDRIFRSSQGAFRGEVIDWIELPHWPIFNIADSAIVIAAGIAIVLSFANIAPILPASPESTDKKGGKDA